MSAACQCLPQSLDDCNQERTFSFNGSPGGRVKKHSTAMNPSAGSEDDAVFVADIVAAADFATVEDTQRRLRLAASPRYQSTAEAHSLCRCMHAQKPAEVIGRVRPTYLAANTLHSNANGSCEQLITTSKTKWYSDHNKQQACAKFPTTLQPNTRSA